MSAPRITDEDLDRLIREDVPYGDLTTRSLALSGQPAEIVFRAGAALVACSTEEAARIMTRLGCVATLAVASGVSVATGEELLSARGPADAVLAGWKVAQTLMEYASGIASAAARIVEAARSVRPDAVVACTRKTFPGTKAVAIKAIVAGGAIPHRLGLSDTLLMFPEHRALLGAVPLAEAIRRLKASCPEKKVVVEVTAEDDAGAAAEAGADVVQLEKFAPDRVAAVARRLAGGTALIAAAGGINAANAAAYAAAGARILVTSAPYSAPPVDVKVTIVPATR
ncbi:MAG: ModD protein [Magnetospirillum sp.]|nr:ModD protein [Magnetospirillum sp.]